MQDRSHRQTLLLLAATLAVSLGLAAGEVWSQGDATYEQYNEGSRLYQHYCSNCHGPEARGDGRIAELLKVPPADLRQLTDEEGEFPAERVSKIIDGTGGMKIHGSREMPIWGQVFLEGEDPGPEEEEAAQEKIDALVVYLEQIQEPAAEGR